MTRKEVLNSIGYWQGMLEIKCEVEGVEQTLQLADKEEMIDKACEFWHKALVNDKDPYKSMWLALIDKFRKEMTTEEDKKGLHTPEDLLPKTKSTQEHIDKLVGTESTLYPVDDLALNDMADAAFKERTADMSIQILSDSNFFFKEGFVAGYNKAKIEHL